MMKDRWSQIAEQARRAQKPGAEEMPFGFAESVLRRLASAQRPNPAEAWIPLLRPALGLAFATAFLCVLLQTRTQSQSNLPENLIVQTENLIQMAILE